MTPTYTLYQCDCLDILPTLEAGSVDAILTDLPYGTTACAWDEIIPFAPMWAGVKRVLKPRGAFVTTASQPFTSKLVMSNLDWFKYCLVWEKTRKTGFLNANNRPLVNTEDICVFCQEVSTYNPQMVKGASHSNGQNTKRDNCPTNVYGKFNKVLYDTNEYHPTSILKFKNVPPLEYSHPTQKPVALMEYLIKTYTNPGDTVLDFTMGSGTTGVACMRTGRNFIGIELDAEYYRIAETRIRNAAGEFVLTDNERERGQLPLWGCG